MKGYSVRSNLPVNEGTVLPTRREHDFYPTPADKVIDGLDILCEDLKETHGRDMIERRSPAIIDPGAGEGAWGMECRRRWPQSFLTGYEIRDVPIPNGYQHWCPEDFCSPDIRIPQGTADFVVGNPPYSHAEEFVRRGLECLKPGGRLVFLLRLAFLESVGRAEGLFREFPPKRVVVCARRPSFYKSDKGATTNATAFCFILWKKGWSGETTLSWK